MSEGSIVTICAAVVTLGTGLIGYLTLLAKLKYGVKQAENAATKAAVVEKKIDVNTQLTIKGNEAAATAANTAADKAQVAADKAEDVSKQLNGDMDNRIRTIVRDEVRLALTEHRNKMS